MHRRRHGRGGAVRTVRLIAFGVASAIAIACVGCHGNPSPPGPDAQAILAEMAREELDAGPADAAPRARTVTLLFSPRDGGVPKRVFVNDVIVKRMLADGGATQVAVSPGDAGDPALEQVLSLAAPEGNYRAHLLVGVCAAQERERDGGCAKLNARPLNVDFVLPPSGDVVVEVR